MTQEGKEDTLPKKPLPRERCAMAARKALKQAESEGKKPLCASCSEDKHTICRATGHAICPRRKRIGWIPVPFSTEECGLYEPRLETA